MTEKIFVQSKMIEDLTNKYYGKLLVKSFAYRERGVDTFWNCICECGNEIITRTKSLKGGNSKSCGCLFDEYSKSKKFKDYSNIKFNRLLAIKPTNNLTSDRSMIWEFLCDCGKKHITDIHSVKRGSTTSCGCYHSEKMKTMCGDKNPSWNPNKTDEERQIKRNINGYKEWRIKVYKNNNYKCYKCQSSIRGERKAIERAVTAARPDGRIIGIGTAGLRNRSAWRHPGSSIIQWFVVPRGNVDSTCGLPPQAVAPVQSWQVPAKPDLQSVPIRLRNARHALPLPGIERRA